MNLLLGSTDFSFGHGTFIGIGAYTGAMLFTFGVTTSFEVYLVSGVLAVTALATVFGFLWAATTKIYFSILTLAFGQVVHALFVSGAVFLPFGPRGKWFFLIGNGGLYLRRLTMLGIDFEPETFSLVLYYVVLGFFAVSGALLWRVEQSPFGMSLRAIRDNAPEPRASASGWNATGGAPSSSPGCSPASRARCSASWIGRSRLSSSTGSHPPSSSWRASLVAPATSSDRSSAPSGSSR
jgi:ABC-type branched-subunit amino acid transport system permease subunit